MQQPVSDKKYALIIGANGGIGKEVVRQLSEQPKFETIFTLSRSAATFTHDASTQVVHKVMDTANEVAVKSFIDELKGQGIKLSLVICTTGILHQEPVSVDGADVVKLKPEKRL
ncbi:MAG: short-subunit dehydrogenase, partial [Glaciecola sp.]